MRKKAKVDGLHIICPICGTYCDRLTELAWCSNCYTEWFLSDGGLHWFDTNRRTERFEIAKAFAKAGGAMIGVTEEGKL